jgi:hypothetical protein
MTNDTKQKPTLVDALTFIRTASVDDIRVLYDAAKARVAALQVRAGAELAFGDTVTFEHKKWGMLKGRITGHKGKNVLVTLTAANILAPRQWRISPTLLTKVVTP